MKILGIDTSCDDTCVSLLEIKKKFEILSNIISSQAKLHAKYGGVYPFLAKREHQRNLPIVFNKVKSQISNIDLIAVTIGPGLEPCLWQGINFASDLAKNLVKPLILVNHIEAHILANWLPPALNSKIQNLFPAICLVVSGGHTQLIIMRGIGKYKLIGETRDDAAGECFDKVARILGLGYPGGPIVATEAARCKVKGLRFKVCLPRPMIKQKNYDFSFSGLKTAVLYRVRSMPPLASLAFGGKSEELKKKEFISSMCAEVQQAIIDVLIHKTLKAAKDFKVKSIILGGGVSANDELRKQFSSAISNQQSAVRFFVPSKNLCTDNAAMVAITAYFRWMRGEKKDRQEIKADANLRI